MAVEYMVKYAFGGVRLNAFNNPETALKSIHKLDPDILFLDINMPDIDGWTFLDYISDHPIRGNVCVLSSSVSPGDIKKAATYECVTEFISKPLTKSSLQRLLIS